MVFLVVRRYSHLDLEYLLVVDDSIELLGSFVDFEFAQEGTRKMEG